MRIQPQHPLFLPIGSGGTGGVGSGNSGGIGSGSSGGIPSGPGGIPSGPGGIRSGVNAWRANESPVPDPNMRRTDLEALHPAMRQSVKQLLEQFAIEQIPFRVFEAFRSPVRQDWLYSQGRKRPGAKVTNARPWESYHQYGMAVDFVLWLNEKWSWSTAGIHQSYWKRLHQLGAEVGLEPLSFELPHLQVAGLKLTDLKNGIYPDGEDHLWRDNLEASVITWNGTPAGPRLDSERPALAVNPRRR